MHSKRVKELQGNSPNMTEEPIGDGVTNEGGKSPEERTM